MAKKNKKGKYKKVQESKKKMNKDEIENLKRNLMDKKQININNMQSNKYKKNQKNNKNELFDLNQKIEGDLSLKKGISSKSKKTLGNEKKDNSPTLLDMINNKQGMTEIQLIKGSSEKPKNSHKKKEIQKKDLTENNILMKKNEEKIKNDYQKRIKPKISYVNGKYIIEKQDIKTINQQFNEEQNKNISPKETIFVSNEEDNENVNSLSFLNIEHTKKWSQDETNLFYKGLELFGLDFSFLEIVLKPRKRVEIKRKYLKEKKENPKEIEKAISTRKNVVKLNDILNLYQKQNNQNNLNLQNNQSSLGLIKEESFSKKKLSEKEEKIDFNKEYKEILRKI